MDKTKYDKVAWWRYPLAIIVFLLGYFFLPILVGLALTVTDWLSPEYFKNGDLWIFVFSDILATGIAFSWVDGIMQKKQYIFQAVWAAIVAVYSFFTAIYNWVCEISTLDQFLGVLAMGVVALVFVGISCKENAKVKAEV